MPLLMVCRGRLPFELAMEAPEVEVGMLRVVIRDCESGGEGTDDDEADGARTVDVLGVAASEESESTWLSSVSVGIVVTCDATCRLRSHSRVAA